MNDMTRVKAERSVEAEQTQAKPPRGRAGRLFGIGVLLLLAAGLVFGAWRYYAQARETMADAAQRQSLVPTVRTATVKAGDPTMLVSLPGTTSAFATADIFARASGYIAKRNVDIGDQVKQGAASRRDLRARDRSSDRASASHAQPERSGIAPAAGQCRSCQRHLGSRQAAGGAGLGDGPAGRCRPPEFAGAASGRRCGAVECRGPTGADQGAAAGEGLSQRARAVRRRRHEAQYRRGQPGAGRRHHRHLHVHA